MACRWGVIGGGRRGRGQQAVTGGWGLGLWAWPVDAGPARRRGRGLRWRARRSRTFPWRLCTRKAIFGDMRSSSDSCSESFFLSLSMALLPLFALCGERMQSGVQPQPSAARNCSACPGLDPRSAEDRSPWTGPRPHRPGRARAARVLSPPSLKEQVLPPTDLPSFTFSKLRTPCRGLW